MDLSAVGVRATSGTLRAADGVVLRHAWTDEGVVAGPALIDEVAEIPRAQRAGVSVTRAD